MSVLPALPGPAEARRESDPLELQFGAPLWVLGVELGSRAEASALGHASSVLTLLGLLIRYCISA